MMQDTRETLGWFGIARLGLVQTALGSIVVLTTAALNRVMVVEHALPAMVPGALVGLHYAVQSLRPRLGHGSDQGGRRTPWIIGGMAVLGLGATLAAVATAWIPTAFVPALVLAVLAFLLIGLGVGASGTSLLVLLAGCVEARRKPAAASLVWIMMIAGFVITTAVTGRLLDPYTPSRLIGVTAGVSVIAFLVAGLAVLGIEGRSRVVAGPSPRPTTFRRAMQEVWTEPSARRFTVFVFISMLAYSAQDLILEPFAGSVFGMTLGETTRLSSVQHGGVLAGMVLIAVVGSCMKGGIAVLRGWIVGGCMAAGFTLLALALASADPNAFPITPVYFVLGLSNGAFAAAAIAAMMQMVSDGRPGREGVRMGMFGAAQALAFGLGGLLGTIILDAGRLSTGTVGGGYVVVFLADAALFLAAASLGLAIGRQDTQNRDLVPTAPAMVSGG